VKENRILETIMGKGAEQRWLLKTKELVPRNVRLHEGERVI